MHEMGIANSVLEAVRTEASRHPDNRPVKVGLRIGELAAIDQESLRFCFEALTARTDLDGLQLEIEFRPRRHHCPACRTDFVVHDYHFQCPGCHSLTSECVSGDELELTFLELEQYESSAAGTKSSQ
jgi:hydrogenase nickel incorporation protein HypA/HybF